MTAILHSEYKKAKALVDAYIKQIESWDANIHPNICDLKIDQKVHIVAKFGTYDYDYWVTEIIGHDVLIRTRENINDREYDDRWVNIIEIRLPKNDQ